MSTKKNVCFLILFLIAMLFTQKASATLTSSYHDGRTYYNTDEGLMGRIDFAVYDTDQSYEHNQEYLDNGLEKPGTGRYVYAYQIFSSFFSGGDGVETFSVLDIDGDPISEALINSTTAQDDGEGGITPSPIDSETQGVWKWTFDGGYISQGQHSWFLVFSSEYDWVPGSYEITGPQEQDLSVPAPEPVTLLFLGLGGAALLVRPTYRLSI